MKLYNKIKWVLGILMVFFLILATNLLDRHNFIRVRDSVVSLYEDRLLAKGLIYELSRSIQEKELALVTADSMFYKSRNQEVNTDIENNLISFENTKLTYREEKLYNNLKTDFEKLKAMENRFVKSGYEREEQLREHIEQVKTDLYELSKIQLVEGKRQMAISQQAVNAVEVFTHIEIYILIILAVIIQIVVIYKPKED